MFYNNGFENSYEELSSYYPAFYRNVLEMKAILEAEGRLLDGCLGAADAMLNNAFVMTANEAMITRLEAFLGIETDKNRSLEERRSLVYSFYIGSGKLSASKLKSVLRSYTSSDISISLERTDAEGNNTLVIIISREGTEKVSVNYGELEAALQKMIPAHIGYTVYFKYTSPLLVSSGHTNHIYDMTFCGVVPEPATVCSFNEAETVTETGEASTSYVKTHAFCGTAVAGMI